MDLFQGSILIRYGKRFRAACDAFFNAKSSYYANIHEHEADNLKKKQEILEQIKAHKFGKDKAENLKRDQGLPKEVDGDWLCPNQRKRENPE